MILRESVTCLRSPRKSPPFTSEGRKVFALPSTPPLTRMLWTSLGPAASGSVFPEIRSVGGQGWKVGGWDRRGFCPTLRGSQIPSPHLSSLPGSLRFPKATWMLPSELALPTRGLQGCCPPKRMGGQKGEAGRQTEGEADAFLLCPLIPRRYHCSVSLPSSPSLPLPRCPLLPPPHPQAAPASHQIG